LTMSKKVDNIRYYFRDISEEETNVMNILNVIKGFIGTHKLASIITASVVGVGAIGGTTAGVIHAVNNNDNDTKTESVATVNTTDMTAASLEGQEINPADLQDVTEEVQADGTTVIKDKNGTVVAKKDQSGKTTLTKDGGVALASGSMQASGDLATNVSNAQAQTQTYVASMPSNDVSYTASTPGSTPSPAPSNNYVAPSTPTFSQPADCSHNWVTVPEKYHMVHHDAEYTEADVPIKELRSYEKCAICGYKVYCTEDNWQGKIAQHATEVHNGHYSIGTGSEAVVVGYEHRTNKVKDEWDETVIDEYGYTYCSKCGERR